MGINLVLKQLPNSKSWIATSWSIRLIRGIVGFCLNLLIVSIANNIHFKSMSNCYLLLSLIYLLSGYASFGLLPIFFSYCKMTNLNTDDKKESNIFNRNILVDDGVNEHEKLLQGGNKYYELDKDLNLI